MGKASLYENEIQIYIISPIELQNVLLSYFIEEKTGLKCCHKQNIDKSILKNRSSLLLLDYLNPDAKPPWTRFNSLLNSHFNKRRVALFNVCPEELTPEEAIKRGIHGIFYENDSPFTIAKGAQSILKGELWFSRNILSKTLSNRMQAFCINKENQPMLTLREKEILAKIAEGATNSEIADALCISIHTVKSHLYNIFEKINVSSRLQALLWATKHL